MTTRRRRLPFGAEMTDQGVQFRLWAPGARSVALRLEGIADDLPMETEADGWVRAHVPEAAVGSLYNFVIDDELAVPDPASRFQPRGVHGPSQVVDPASFQWRDDEWRGRPWTDVVFYELHTGVFSPEGTFAGIEARLDHLVALGITAIELMPVSSFPGCRGWGYDGVLPFAPTANYGQPDDLKRLVASAHARGLMVFLDVVYNHFGPEGNYLHRYAPTFFTGAHKTPWGAAINFDAEGSRVVRQYFIENALYWLEEYHLDGLRLDAVHAIADDSTPHILQELADAVRQGPGRDRHVHLVLENDANQARWLSRDAAGRPNAYVAQWNDDAHHVVHTLLTGERGGYYADYADAARQRLARVLAEGFAYQGDPSPTRGGEPRGEPSAHLPPGAFVTFIQNHDQIGNRAFGERLTEITEPAAVEAALVLMLLAPSTPLLFMGEEWGSRRPFPFFCDFGDELADAVREGRRREFARFPEFADPATRERIPDPNDVETFTGALLDWDALVEPEHAARLALTQRLLTLRRTLITPHLGSVRHLDTRDVPGEPLRVAWELADDVRLTVVANLCAAAASVTLAPPNGELIVSVATPATGPTSNTRPGHSAWSVAWYLA